MRRPCAEECNNQRGLPNTKNSREGDKVPVKKQYRDFVKKFNPKSKASKKMEVTKRLLMSLATIRMK